MAHFSDSSIKRLASLDPRLRLLLLMAIEHYNFSILCTHRTEAEQQEAFEQGRSKKQWPESPHNKLPCRAFDVAPFPIDWKDLQRFYHFAGYLMGLATYMKIPLRWGGDWDGDGDFSDQDFNDLVHFELNE